MNIEEFNLLLEKANNGDVESQQEIGEIYYHGAPLEIQSNLKKALHWHLKAAEGGNVTSQLIVANSYYDGFGVERDIKKAIFWWRKAELGGNPYAVKKLERISSYNERNIKEENHASL